MDSYIYISLAVPCLVFFEQLLSSQGKSCQVRDRTGVGSIVVFSNYSVTYFQFQGSSPAGFVGILLMQLLYGKNEFPYYSQ